VKSAIFALKGVPESYVYFYCRERREVQYLQYARHAFIFFFRYLYTRILSLTDDYLSPCSIDHEKERSTYHERRSMHVTRLHMGVFDVTFKASCSRALLIALRRTGSLLILRMSLITTNSLKLQGIYDPARQALVRYIFD